MQPSTDAPRVLLVEDEAIIALDLEQTLLDLGFRPTGITGTAEEALEAAARSMPDVVLMDIRIRGGRDGIEAAALLRESYAIPVVFLTAHSDTTTLARALQTSPYGYLVKPVDPRALRTTLEVAVHRCRLERALSARERWFAATVDAIADGVLTTDPEGHVTYANPAAQAVLGATAEALAGQPLERVLRFVDPEPEPPLASPRALLTLDGSTRRVRRATREVQDRATQLGTVTVVHDVTDEEQLRRRAEQAERLASLATMAAGVAHEVNNPLTVILGNLDEVRKLLADSTAASRALIRELLDDMDLAGRQVAQVVSDLRDLSSPAPPAEAPPQADVLAAVRWACRASRKEVAPRAEVRVAVPQGLEVAMEASRLGQILVNLLVNAGQAFPEADPGRQHIDLHAARVGDEVRITVADNGPGLAEAAADRIFEPFFSTKGDGGMGIGLAICRGLAEAAGGELGVRSTPGAGAVFTLCLPA